MNSSKNKGPLLGPFLYLIGVKQLSAMKSLALILFFSLCFHFSRSQDTLSLQLARQYAYSFSMDKETIQGAGWDSLKKELHNSQFIVLGENHYSPLLSIFTMHLLNAAASNGFKHFLLETGPIAAKKVVSLYSPDEAVYRERIHDFLSTFKQQKGSPPSEFVTMKNDIPMLQAAVKNKYNVAGLDKEYFSSIDYLLNELGKFAVSSSLKTEYAAALKSAETYKKEELAGKNYPYITRCKTDTAIKLFLNHIGSQNAAARQIVEEMQKTFTIYGLYEDKQYHQSEIVRTANIKKNFGSLYYKNTGNNPAGFKAIVKIGNMHSQRGISFQNIYDIGNAVAELAAINGTNSTHIQCMRRYRKSATGEVSDFYNNGYEVYPNFITQTDSTQWVVVDLRPIRKLMMSGKIKVKIKDEKDLIMQNDLLLLIPVDGAYNESLNYD